MKDASELAHEALLPARVQLQSRRGIRGGRPEAAIKDESELAQEALLPEPARSSRPQSRGQEEEEEEEEGQRQH